MSEANSKFVEVETLPAKYADRKLDDAYIHPEVKAEILRRRDEADASPELLERWTGTTERVRAKLHELRRQKVQDR